MNKINQLNDIFASIKVGAHCISFKQLKRAISYDIELSPGTRIKSIERYLNEISMALKAPSKPTLHVLSEQGIVRLEYMTHDNQTVNLFDLGANAIKPQGNLQCLLGEAPEGDLVWCDITTLPHLLVAGTTGSGKSTVLHTIIANLLTYNNVIIDVLDTKNIEYQKYKGFNQIRTSFNFQSCISSINDLYHEMERRYKVMQGNDNVSQLFPYRVMIIDEFADLIMQDQDGHFRQTLCKLAQKSRSAGIHIILATQRPSADIINGAIKANFPARLACRTASGIDSKIILDAPGADKLHGRGDAIMKINDYTRFQIAFTTPDEVCNHFYGSAISH